MVSGVRPASIRARSLVKALRATTRSQPASRAATARSFWMWERKPTVGTSRVASSDLTSLRSVSGSKRAELRSRTSRSGGDSRRASSNLLGLRGKAASIPRFKAVSEILLLNTRSSTAARTLLVTFASVHNGWVSSHILPAGGAVSYTGEKLEGASRRAKAHQGDALQLHAFLEASPLGTSAGAQRVAAGDGDEPRAALAARAHHRLRAYRQQATARSSARCAGRQSATPRRDSLPHRTHLHGNEERSLLPALPAAEAGAADCLRHAGGPLCEGPRPGTRLPRQEAYGRYHNPGHQRRERGTHHAGRFGGRGVLLGHDPARDVGRYALARLAAYPPRPRHSSLPLPRRKPLQEGTRAADAHCEDEGGGDRQRHAGGHNRYKGRQTLRPRGGRDGALQEGEQRVPRSQRRERYDRGKVQHRPRNRRRLGHGACGLLRGEAGSGGRPLFGRPYRLCGLPGPVSLAPVGPEPAGEPDRHLPRLGRADH